MEEFIPASDSPDNLSSNEQTDIDSTTSIIYPQQCDIPDVNIRCEQLEKQVNDLTKELNYSRKENMSFQWKKDFIFQVNLLKNMRMRNVKNIYICIIV